MPWRLGSIGSPVVWSRPTTLPLSCSDCKRTRKSPVLPLTLAETGQQITPQSPVLKFFTASVSSAFACLTPHFALHEKMNYAKENGNKPQAWSKHPECQDQSYQQEFWEPLAMHLQKLRPQVAHAATDKFITLAQSTEYEHKHLILHKEIWQNTWVTRKMQHRKVWVYAENYPLNCFLDHIHQMLPCCNLKSSCSLRHKHQSTRAGHSSMTLNHPGDLRVWTL